MSNNRFSAFFKIQERLNSNGLEIDRSELIAEFTHNKKTSLTDLTPWEYSELLNWLNRTFPSEQDPKKIQANLMRRKIIALFRKIEWQQDGKADMERIYAWTLKYGYLNKPLNEYTYDELPQLVTQVETIYTKYLLAK
jgi:hypothetical protein